VPGSTFTAGYDIADNGYISGRYDGADRRRHGFMLIEGQFQTIDYPGSIFTHANGTYTYRPFLPQPGRGRNDQGLCRRLLRGCEASAQASTFPSSVHVSRRIGRDP
jgi:hypothetical protein